MIGSDPRSEMLFDMGQCAYRLGKTFAAEAERAETHERRMEFFHLFDRCSFAVRMSIALELRLRLRRGSRGGRRPLGAKPSIARPPSATRAIRPRPSATSRVIGSASASRPAYRCS